jgi:hypothetical protein
LVRDRCNKKWLALLSTNTALGDEKIVTAYKYRWDIEEFFKVAKSFLNLVKHVRGGSMMRLSLMPPRRCTADISCWP